MRERRGLTRLHDRDLDVCDFDDSPQLFDLLKSYVVIHMARVWCMSTFGSDSKTAAKLLDFFK